MVQRTNRRLRHSAAKATRGTTRQVRPVRFSTACYVTTYKSVSIHPLTTLRILLHPMLEPIILNLPTHFQQSKKKRVFLGLNWFRNAHFLVVNKSKAVLHALTTDLLSESIPDKPYKGRYRITSTYCYESKISDLDNSVLLVKYVNDSLQKLGIVANDNVESCVEIILAVGEKQIRGEGYSEIRVEFLD